MATDKGKFSQYDMGGIAKHTHDEHARAVRIIAANSEVPGGYSRVEFENNLLGSIILATFYRGISSQKTRIKFVGDSGGSLNNTYFLLNAAEDRPECYVWYNVGGAGVDPTLPDKCGIEVPLSVNDPVEIVALATKRYVENSEHFDVQQNGDDVIIIETSALGQTSNTVDFGTGFFITTPQEGVTDRIKCIELPEESGIRYIFNYAEGKFEIIPSGVKIEGLVVKEWDVLNVAAPIASAEYILTLPINCRRFEIKTRSNGKFHIASSAGESGTVFRTIPAGNTYKEEGLVLTVPLNVYFQCAKADDVLEVVLYF